MHIDIFIPFDSVNPAIVTGAANVTTRLTRGTCVRVFNNSTFPAFIRFGDAGAVATANDIGLAAGSVEMFSVAPSTFQQMGTTIAPTHIGAISPGGAGLLSVTTGEGA